MAAPPGDDLRGRLAGDLVKHLFQGYHGVSAGQTESFLSLDKGLSVISRHASDLGYDALILFLDELILWLASHAARPDFVHQEGQKLAKLVESQTPDRPVPIVSFVARQRDLRDLVGKNAPAPSSSTSPTPCGTGRAGSTRSSWRTATSPSSPRSACCGPGTSRAAAS